MKPHFNRKSSHFEKQITVKISPVSPDSPANLPDILEKDSNKIVIKKCQMTVEAKVANCLGALLNKLQIQADNIQNLENEASFKDFLQSTINFLQNSSFDTIFTTEPSLNNVDINIDLQDTPSLNLLKQLSGIINIVNQMQLAQQETSHALNKFRLVIQKSQNKLNNILQKAEERHPPRLLTNEHDTVKTLQETIQNRSQSKSNKETQLATLQKVYNDTLSSIKSNEDLPKAIKTLKAYLRDNDISKDILENNMFSEENIETLLNMNVALQILPTALPATRPKTKKVLSNREKLFDKTVMVVAIFLLALGHIRTGKRLQSQPQYTQIKARYSIKEFRVALKQNEKTFYKELTEGKNKQDTKEIITKQIVHLVRFFVQSKPGDNATSNPLVFSGKEDAFKLTYLSENKPTEVNVRIINFLESTKQVTPITYTDDDGKPYLTVPVIQKFRNVEFEVTFKGATNAQEQFKVEVPMDMRIDIPKEQNIDLKTILSIDKNCMNR
jgi:hypothetical protein